MDTNNNFFPDPSYEIPVSSNYFKLQEGENNFRVLSSAITGFEYWSNEGKPVRSKEKPDIDSIFENMRVEKDSSQGIKHFWAFVVWNYEAKKVQILEITQKGIMKTMKGLIDNPKWGNPREYDITITRSGSGFDTEYSVIPNPKVEIDDSILAVYEGMHIRLEALFDSADPFMPVK